MTDLAGLLADCDARRIRLLAAGDVGLTIDAPQDALTPDLIGRLKAHKGELLGLLRSTPNVGRDPPGVTKIVPERPAKVVCRCGATTWRDVPIHDGQSVRRDCGGCGRFLDFSVWYGNGTLHNEQ
jgi:hypothetical protein